MADLYIINLIENSLGDFRAMGGPGSGHHHHAGRKGKRGGSAPSRAGGPPKAGKPLGGRGGSGTRYGYFADGSRFVEDSKVKSDLFHGTPHPESVLEKGLEVSSDEVNWYPGISLGRTTEESRGYHESELGTGAIFRVKAFTENPVEFGDIAKVKGWEGGDIGEFYKLAHEQGFDAVIGPGEVRVFSPTQVMILGKGFRKWVPFDES